MATFSALGGLFCSSWPHTASHNKYYNIIDRIICILEMVSCMASFEAHMVAKEESYHSFYYPNFVQKVSSNASNRVKNGMSGDFLNQLCVCSSVLHIMFPLTSDFSRIVKPYLSHSGISSYFSTIPVKDLVDWNDKDHRTAYFTVAVIDTEDMSLLWLGISTFDTA